MAPAGASRASSPVLGMGFTVAGDRIVAIDAISDPMRLGRLDLAAIDD